MEREPQALPVSPQFAKMRITAPSGKTGEGNFGWADLSPQVAEGTIVTQCVADDTLPGGPRIAERTYTAPFARASREDDYRTAWAFFEQRKGDS